MSSQAFSCAVATDTKDIPSLPRARSSQPAESYVSADGEHRSVLIWGAFPRLQVATVLMVPSRLYRLRGMFVVEISHLEEGTVYARHRSLPVYGYGQDLAEALSAFAAAFDMQWRSLVEEEDLSVLSSHALESKAALQSAVSDVTNL